MIRLKVVASPSEISCKTFTFSPSDHGFTDKEWKKLSDSEQQDQVMQFLESIPEQPFWTIDGFEEQ
jgi:hypothetical protein